MDKKELLDLVNGKLSEKFHGSIEAAELLSDFPVFVVNKEKIHDVLSFLKNDSDLNFHFLTDLTGIQTPDEKQLGVVYHLHNMPKNLRIRVKTFFPINHPEIPTATDLWLGANWMERETFDFFGVKFMGHPNLKRILNMDEMDYHPLRKEYPLEDQTREDKDDRMFGR
ncbi:MAG: NADH-quinone oxidoreductase subunit C [Bacteroidota bacterium]|jgi:NADH-quinone oxidoreductase subunit C